MTDLPYMNLWVKDFIADTVRLNAAQTGAYLSLIMDYWINQAPPRDDDAELARVARCSPAEWRRTRPALERFFDCDEDGTFRSWRHSRVETELTNALAKRERRATAGGKGGKAKAAKVKPPPSNARPLPPAMLKQPESESKPDSNDRTNLDSVPRARDPNALLDQLIGAAGGNVVHGASGIEVVRPVLDLIAADCDLELDVLPAVREVVQKLETPLRTWGAGFLRDAILAKQAARLRGRGSVPPTGRPLDTRDRWRLWLTRWKEGRWADGWGAKPGEPLCEIPQWFVDEWKAEAA